MKITLGKMVKQTSNCRSFRVWIIAAILLSLQMFAETVRAQLVTNIIYQDNFARTGQLDGTAPDTVNLPGATWVACNVPSQNAQIQTDGSELALTNVPGTTNGFYLNGFLPFVPQVGHIYSLSCNIKPISGGNQWLALGFATHALTNNYFATYQCGSGWLLVRGNGGQIQTWGALTGSSTFTNYIGTNFQTFTVTLDTTTGNSQRNWSIKFYTNNVLVPGGNYTIPWGNYPIKYVGIGADAGQGYFQQFTLTDVQVFSGTPTIVEGPQNTTAQEGQTATFWVGVTNDFPAAAYQWMTNSASGPTNAIPGATNAFYTTPTLDMSYNGLNYSVVVSNALGTTNSAPAALTVVSGPPTVYSAEKTSTLTNIVVAFSKAIDPATGLNPANYSVTINGASSGVSILSASYGSASNNVVLMTSTLDTNVGYYLVVQNVKDQFGSAMSGTANVPVLPAGLVLYLRADSGVVYDGSGSLVAQWRDQTTNANDVVQYFGVPTAGPNYLGPVVRPTTSTFNNGQLAVDFGSTIHWLAAPSTPSLESMTNNTTMYAVANFTGASDELVNKVWGNLPAPFDWDPNPNENVQYGNGGNNAPANGIGSSVSQNTPYVLTSMLAFPPASGVTNIFNFWLNGANNGSGSIRPLTDNPPVLWDAGFPLWVGARWDLVNPRMKGQIAEIMLFNTALSGADRTNVDNYLGQKYFTFSIAQNLPPTTTSTNGFAVTYTFVASQGSVHGYGFQWQANGTNIFGANGSSYTTPVLGPGDNGDTFDVIVTLPDGSTTNSVTNTLTVLTQPPIPNWAGIPIWSTTNIVITFDEAVDPVTASVAANYSLNNGATVFSAAVGDMPNKVVLTTSTLGWDANPGFYTLAIQNVKDLYNNTVANTSLPVGLYPNAAVWLKANTGVTTDSGTNTVNEWADLSGNNNNFFSAGGPTIQPILATNAWGDPVVRFNTVNTYTNYMAAADSPSLEITGDMSVIAVMNFATLANGRSGHIVSKTGSVLLNLGNIPAPFDYSVGSAAATFLRGNGNGTTAGINYGSYGATNGPSTNYPYVMTVSEMGNTVSHYLDGRGVGSDVLNSGFQEANAFDQGQAVYIGKRADGFNRLIGDLSELIVASSPLSTNDAVALANYLGTEHNFPTVNVNPTNIVVSLTNNQMLLSWPADHTGWQLQSNGVGLMATSAWFTVSGSATTNQIIISPDMTKTNVFYRMLYQP